MNYKNKLNQIKVVLGLEVRLAQEKLVDGTIVEAEAFEPGFPVFVVTENGPTPAPMGEHETESLVVVVDDQGIITEIRDREAEEPEAEVETEISIEAAAEEVVVEEKEEMEEDKSYKETMQKLVEMVEDVVKEVAEVKTEMASMKEKFSKFSKEPGAEKAPTITKGSVDGFDLAEARAEALYKMKQQNLFKHTK